MAGFADMFIQQAMAQNEQAHNPNAGSGFMEGAQLAQHAEQLQQQQQQLKQRQQELQMAKLDKVGNWFEQAAKMDDGPTKKAFLNNYVPNGINALGLQDVFHPDSLKMAQTEPMALMYMRTKVQQDPNYLTDTLLPAAGDPEKFAALAASPEFQQFKGQQLTQPALQESLGSLKKEFDKGNTEQNKMLRAQVAAQVQAGRQEKTFAHEDMKDEQTFRTQVANKVGSDLHPLVSDKAHLNSALNAGQRVLDAVAAGKRPNQSDTTLLATGLATTISKRINPTEFENIMHLPGAENWGIDQWNKYLAGGSNMNVVKALMAAAHSQDDQLNQEIGAVRDRLTSEVETSRFGHKKDSILQPLQKELAAMPKASAGKGNGVLSYGGRTEPRAFWESFLKDHPDDPAAPAVRQLLGKGK